MPTGQVRIVGAERAADVAGASPTIHQANGAAAEEPREEGLGDAAERWTAGTGATLDEALPDEVHPSSLEGALDEDALDEDALDGWPEAAEPELLHWTEAPTGEVPAVLARPGDEPRGAVPEPSWRESPEDWDVDEAAGSPILEPGGAEAVTETDPSERQPWSFDLGTPHAGSGPEGLGGLDELEDLDTTELFAPWPEAGSRNPRPAVPGLGARTPPEDAASGSGRPGEGLVHGTGQVEPAEREEELEGVQGHLATDARPGPGTSGATPDVAEIAGERTSVLPIVETTSHAHARETHEEEAAALDADLQEHGLRRRLQMRRPETVRGTTARHRARAVAVTAPPRPTAAKARPEDRVSRRAGRNIPVAVASGLVIGALALVAFHFGSVPSLVVVSVVLALAAAEAYAAFRRAGYRPVTVLGIAAVAGVLVGAYDRTFEALPVVLVVLVAFTFLWHLVGVDAKADPVRSTAATVLVFCWVGVFGSFAALLLAPSLFPHRHGIAYLLGALIAAVAYDVGALAVGATLGRHPLSAVSPSKTWEGVAGGAVAAIVLAIAVVRLVHPWTLGEAAALGIVVAVVSPIGDLCESLVKRHLGIKDMGRILPGHGGLLDRVDGLLFVLPATYYLVRAFGHG